MTKPGVSRSTMNADMPPRLPLLRSVSAITIVQSASVAWLIQILRPFSTQLSPSRTAVVDNAPGSEPAPGSEIAIAARVTPRAYGSR